MVHIIHPVHGDQDEGVTVGVCEISPGHVNHLAVGCPTPAVIILSQSSLYWVHCVNITIIRGVGSVLLGLNMAGRWRM